MSLTLTGRDKVIRTVESDMFEILNDYNTVGLKLEGREIIVGTPFTESSPEGRVFGLNSVTAGKVEIYHPAYNNLTINNLQYVALMK